MRGSHRGIWAAVSILILSAILGGVYGPRVEATTSDKGDMEEALRSFTKVYAIIEQNFADPVDPSKAIYNGAIPGMLRTLDPHSAFLDEETFAKMREEQSGHYYGVGMQVGPRDGHVAVGAPFPGSPAYEAGLRPADIIHKVDDTYTKGLNTSQVADLLKGPKGTVVHVQVLREGRDEPLAFVITRDEIPHFSVDVAFELRPGIGYIHLAGFNETTEQEMNDALDKMGRDKLNGLIFDLRGNPGGLLNAAVAVSELFLTKNQLIVSQQGRVQRERPYYSNNTHNRLDVPLVVLVNRQSASASEIVSGALQDHDRALIVGETTFGKALVQTVYPLSHNTGMALTTGRYYTPSGRLIQRDYSGVSLYSYYTSNGNNNGSRKIHRTDNGRTVYGGGGIAPDIEVARPESTSFQERLMRRMIIYTFIGGVFDFTRVIGVGDFTKRYLADNGDISEDFEVDEDVLGQFRSYLHERNVPFTEVDLQQNLAWLKTRIKKELFTSVFGMNEGHKVAIPADPQVLAALEVLPQAEELLKAKRRRVAEKKR